MKFCLSSLISVMVFTSVGYAADAVVWKGSALSMGLGSYTEPSTNPYEEKQTEYTPMVEESSGFGSLISLGSSDGCLFRVSLRGVKFGCTQNTK